MAKMYVRTFIAFGTSRLSSTIPDRPNRGAANMADSAAYIPTSVSSLMSLPRRLILSPTQVHTAAMTPVSPASGPTEPPKTNGRIAPTDMAPRSW